MAEKSRAALYQDVQNKIKAEEAERLRQANAEARRVAAEKQRLIQEEQMKHATEEAQRLDEQKRQATERRRIEAAAVYRQPPRTARLALNAIKKVAARVEVGVTYADYSSVVGATWGDVKIFIESSDGKKVPEFNSLLTRAMACYKLALDIWRNKIKFTSLYKDRPEVDALQQLCWLQADACIDLAEKLLESEDKAKALETVGSALSKIEDLDAKWKKIEDNILRQ